MKLIKIILALAIISLALSIFITSASAQVSTGSASFVKTQSNINQYYAGQLSTYYPILADKTTCEARQDIVLQVSPVGCQPAVVRSDLLADQNVPVFCQIDAIRLNPFISVDSIRNIRFSTVDSVQGVQGVGFHPARAAIRTGDRLTGSPLIDNLGYAVISLKQNPNEDSLPETIDVKLNARIEYESQGAIGTGRTDFLLHSVSEEEWANEKIKQTFFQGQYSVRVMDADSNFATVAIYKGNSKISTTTVERSRPAEILVPGGYCQVSLNLHYDGFIAPEEVVRLKVGEDVIDVYEGSKFLNNKCSVREISGSSAQPKIDLRCGSENLELSLNPVILSAETRVYKTSDLIKNSDTSKVLQLWDIVSYVDGEYTIESGEAQEQVQPNEIIPVEDNLVYEAEYGSQADEIFEKSISEYEIVADNYPYVKKTGDETEKYIGEEALYNAINLAQIMRKGKTQIDLSDKFLELYPSSVYFSDVISRLQNLHLKDNSKSSQSIELDNKFVYIEMLDYTPVTSQRKVVLSVNGLEQEASEKSQIFFSGVGGEDGAITIESIGQDRVTISGTCKGSNSQSQGAINSKTLSLDSSSQSTATVCGRVVKLEDINLEEFAKIRIEPNVKNVQSESQVSVKIGIEKSEIQLSPDKTKQRIDNLEESIKEWESISNNLGTVVEGMKAACFATAGVLTVKNFFTGIGGEALARQDVMRGPDGWTEYCNSKLKENGGIYDSLTQCYNDNNAEINQDVSAQAKAISLVNDELSQIESNHSTSSSSFFGGTSIDREKASQDLIDKINSECRNVNVNITGQNEKVSSVINSTGHVADPISYEQLRDIYRDCLILKGTAGETTPQLKEKTSSSLKSLALQAYDRSKQNEDLANLNNALENTGLVNSQVQILSDENAQDLEYHGDLVDSTSYVNLNVEAGTPAQVVYYSGTAYLVTLQKISTRQNDYGIDQIYEINNGSVTLASETVITDIKGKVGIFKRVDATSYNNEFAQGEYREVQYYETDPYKGMPAIVPFDLDNGWYVATKQTLPGFGNIKSFESSGRPTSFWICNVGENARPDFFKGINDDVCRQFNMQTGQPPNFPGLSPQKSESLMQEAIEALNRAADQYGKGSVTINGRNLKVGSPASSIPGTQCQDFMSPEDCLLLFNVCDPVICPSSRCDFGGTYPVSDVVQTGVVGSALLCLPNVNEGIVAPVCLTGIKAGIDGYLSILQSHKACLQENLDTGRTVGICDQIYSVYACEFFWRQAAPIANILLPKAVEYVYNGGQGTTRGGGEYLAVQESWTNAQESVDFFTQNYAKNAFDAFNIRSVEEAGSQFCKAFVSAKGPDSFKTLVESDSPPQFHAFFSEIPFSDVTVPASSQYKVFYHVFAGNDAGVNFQVYLKDPPATSYYATNPTISVANGFAPRGGFATETRDFTAPAGYKELCVRINGNEQCGFKQVSSSFAVNYVRDSFVQDQISQSDIVSESECISGSLNPSLLLTPNIQEAAQETIDPAIYNRGVIRICSTDNPGDGTGPSRFVEVGYCDTPELKCWLDKESVDKAITRNNVGLQDQTLSQVNDIQKKILSDNGQLYGDADALAKLNELKEKVNSFDAMPNQESVTNAQAIENEINDERSKLFFNHFIAQTHLLVGDTYAKLAKVFSPFQKITNSDEDLEAPLPASSNNQEEETPVDPNLLYYGVRSNSHIYLGEEDTSLVLEPLLGSGSTIQIKFNSQLVGLINGALIGNGQINPDAVISLNPSLPSSLPSNIQSYLSELNGENYASLIEGNKTVGTQVESLIEVQTKNKITYFEFLSNGQEIENDIVNLGEELSLKIKHSCSLITLSTKAPGESQMTSNYFAAEVNLNNLKTTVMGDYLVIVQCVENGVEVQTETKMVTIGVIGEPV